MKFGTGDGQDPEADEDGGGDFAEFAQNDYVDDDDDFQAGWDAGTGTGEEDGPLLPGLYRALYAFEPEGTAEMRLEEDQVVHVLGRGGGVGWAVVLREPGEDGDDGDAARHALVPESYLEFVRLDGDDGE